MKLIILLLIILMIILSALLSAAETAITASAPGKIQKLLLNNQKNASLTLQVLKLKDKVISSLLIGNSLLNTLCISFATGLFIDLLGDPQLGTLISSGVMAFIIIVFAEVIPKAIAVLKAEELAIKAAPAIKVFLDILKPVNFLLDKAVKLFCNIIGINLSQKITGTEEVRGIIEHHHQEGNVYKSDRDMLEGILDIRDMDIAEIMIHRSAVEAINIDLPTKEIINLAFSSTHSRILFWKDDKDNIIGILHIKDLIKSLYDNNHNIDKLNIKNLLSSPWFVPENASVAKQLNAFREQKKHLACVIDEYGDFMGIVTLEDILEEIVGQIQDEHDINSKPIIKKSNNEYIIRGSTTIRDINRELNWYLPDENANTIAGLIIHEIKNIPNQGQKIEILNLQIEIQKKIKNKIEIIKVKLISPFKVINAEE